MLTDPLLWLMGFGCVGAVICAAHSAHIGRWQAVSLACFLLINFVLYQLAYTDWSPKWTLERWGIETTSVHFWMLTDTVSGVAAIVIANRFWWGRGLWLISIIQVGFHTGMDVSLYPADFYTDVLLNLTLLIQLAIFFVIGGAGVADHLRSGFARLRLRQRRARQTAGRLS